MGNSHCSKFERRELPVMVKMWQVTIIVYSSDFYFVFLLCFIHGVFFSEISGSNQIHGLPAKLYKFINSSLGWQFALSWYVPVKSAM